MARARNDKGEFVCSECRGEGAVEVSYDHPNDPAAKIYRQDCPRCSGSRVDTCVECGETATMEGVDPRFIYCSTRCAQADGNWPACEACKVEPQDPMFAPACSGTCRESWDTAQRLARLQGSTS